MNKEREAAALATLHVSSLLKELLDLERDRQIAILVEAIDPARIHQTQGAIKFIAHLLQRAEQAAGNLKR